MKHFGKVICEIQSSLIESTKRWSILLWTFKPDQQNGTK